MLVEIVRTLLIFRALSKGGGMDEEKEGKWDEGREGF